MPGYGPIDTDLGTEYVVRYIYSQPPGEHALSITEIGEWVSAGSNVIVGLSAVAV